MIILKLLLVFIIAYPTAINVHDLAEIIWYTLCKGTSAVGKKKEVMNNISQYRTF